MPPDALPPRPVDFRAIFRRAVEALFLHEVLDGPRFRNVEVSDGFVALAGVPREAVVGRDVRDTIPLLVTEEVLAEYRACVELRAPRTYAPQLQGPSGPRILQSTVFPIADEDGAIRWLLGSTAEVTELRRAEASLRQLSRALDQSPASVLITDARGDLEYVNARFSAVTGYARDEVLGKNPRFLQSGETSRADYERMWQALLAQGEWRGELLNRKKDGTLFWEDVSISRLDDPGSGAPTHYVGVKVDITAQRRLEESFRQAQKMEAFGQLAAGVAHDFNNLLTVIATNLAFARHEAPGEELGEALAEAQEACARAAELTRQLLTFSRRRAPSLRRLELNEAVAGVLRMLRRTLGERVALEHQPSPEALFLDGDLGLLEQAVLNLAVNARDAMPEGGTLRVETAAERFDERTAARHPQRRPGAFARLTVRDTGGGIAPEHLEHIFEPFFTTKEVGRGTGLGLATTFGIVQQHHGWLEVESALGRGTAFHLLLPRADRAGERAEAPAATATRGGDEHLLLVEDDGPLRTVLARQLSQQGYAVTAVGSSAAALEAWGRVRAQVALLVSDVVLPGELSGPALAGRLRAEAPELRVLFITGYGDAGAAELTAFGPHRLLRKPFATAALLAEVRAALDARG